MLHFLFRKINKNRWMIICLLVGFTLAVAMITAVPIYSRGILQRILNKQMEDQLANNAVYPGGYSTSWELELKDQKDSIDNYITITGIIKAFASDLPLEVQADTAVLEGHGFHFNPVEGESGPSRSNINIKAVKYIEDNVRMVSGRIFSSSRTEKNEFEAIVSERTMKQLDLVMNKVYEVQNFRVSTSNSFKVKIVGVYSFEGENNPFWYHGEWEHPDSFIIDHGLFITDFFNTGAGILSRVRWFYAFDYKMVDLKNAYSIIPTMYEHLREVYSYYNTDVYFGVYNMIKEYTVKERQLTATLWIFQVPVLLMIIFYISMISNLIIEREKDEIALIKSRGGARNNILRLYLLESVVLSIIGIVLGPFLGLFLCRILGASNGFLQFVNRAPLKVSITVHEYKYAFIAAVVFIIAMMVPVISVSKTSIVMHKQKKARKTGKPFWMRSYLDIILMLITGYGFYNYRVRQSVLSITNVNAAEIPVDPLLYLISTFMVLSAGLVFLRIYPYFIKLIFLIGRNKWSPELYSALVNVGRSKGKDHFLMIFLIMTVSIGIFNVKAATTVNEGLESKIRYLSGTDIIIKSWWSGVEPDKSEILNPSPVKGPELYVEPPFKPYLNLEGIESVTKVFTTDTGIFAFRNKHIGMTKLMGIIPDEFGRTAWFQPDLLPVHWYHYLNLLAEEPKAMLLSRSLQRAYNLELGDVISIKWGERLFVEGYVYGFIDYWPSYNPTDNMINGLVVANLTYLQKMMPMEPYEVWLKKDPAATNEEIYTSINSSTLSVQSITDAGQELLLRKNDAVLQGTNGALTLCFLSIMVITAMGFLVYWILSIKTRVLQFGILRSMGLSIKKIIGMLISEQILVSGIAIVMGVIIGTISSNITIPLLGITSDIKEQVLPLRSIYYSASYMKVVLILLVMLTAGFIILGWFVSKVDMAQAVKLGED